MRLVWKPFYLLGFILFLSFSGCGEKQPPVEDLVLQAEGLLDSGQISDAIRIFERCQEMAPGRVDVLEGLAFAYAADGDPMLASMTFIRIAELVPLRAEYLLYAAESLLEAGDPKGAIDQYETYLRLNPDDRAVWVALADLHISQGRSNEALEALLAAEQLQPRAQQRIAIGELYLRKQNLAQAQAWFSRALEGDPDVRDEALLGLLETAIRSKRFAEAEALLAQIDAEYPGRLERSDIDGVRDQLAEWRLRQDAAKEAVAALENHRVDVPTEPVVPPVEMVQPTPPPEAVVTEEVTEADGGGVVGPEVSPPEEVEKPAADANDDGLLAQARNQRAAGETAEAIRYYKRALVKNDNQPAVWAELSEAYLEAGNDRWAQATASEAMRREPDNVKFVLQFLRAAQRTMDRERLTHEMETAYRQFPNSPEVILVLARAYAEDGNRRNAWLLFKRFLELAPAGHPSRSSVEMELQQLSNRAS